jgi:hypothetical protein
LEIRKEVTELLKTMEKQERQKRKVESEAPVPLTGEGEKKPKPYHKVNQVALATDWQC